MHKQEFLLQLRKGLSGLPKDELEEHLTFYSEMIDDRMEDGIGEEAAVRELGSVEALVSQTVAEIPLSKLVKERIAPNRKLKAWEIVLLVLGSPVWLPLLLAALAVFAALYVVLWSVLLVLWSVCLAFAVCGAACVAAGVWFIIKGNVMQGLAAVGAGLFCAGLAIFLFFGCKAATKGVWKLTQKIGLWVKNCFVRREEAQ